MSASSDLRRAGDDARHGPLFWTASAVGWAIIGFGVWSLLQRAASTRPAVFAAWFLALVLVHDLVVAPSLSAIAAWVGPRVPGRWLGAVTAAAIVSGALLAVALPPLLGDPADNETILPRNYVGGLVGSVALVWAVALAVGWARGRARGAR